VPRKLVYCVDADPFECANGRVEGKVGCKLSEDASQALTQKNDKGENLVCIDGAFVSTLEGGSYLSPYVPWGPLGGRKTDALPTRTTKNASGVTIGTGVDLGAVGGSPAEDDAHLARLEKAGVSKETRDKLRPLLGKKREDACKALRAAKGAGTMVLPAKDVELIDLDAMKQRVPDLKNRVNKVARNRIEVLKNLAKKEQAKASGIADMGVLNKLQAQIDATKLFDDLSCSEQSILFSTLYHEGNLGSQHSQGFLDAIIAGDDAAAKAALLAKTRDSVALLASRGKQELAYWNALDGK